MPGFGHGGASSILAEVTSIFLYFFLPPFFVHHVRKPDNPDITDNETAYEQCRGCATTSWLQRYTRLSPPIKAESNMTRVPYRAVLLWFSTNMYQVSGTNIFPDLLLLQ